MSLVDMDESSFSAPGSDTWIGADEYEPGSPLHRRATDFLKSVNWDTLADIASKIKGGMPCRYEKSFSIDHFNMVRRINFDDGESWVVRLRLPDENMLTEREALSGSSVMEVELASMKFLGITYTFGKSKTSIPVPKVMGYSTASDNAVGAPYILMEYIHGSVASELRRAKGCAPQMFGTPEQDRKFREQMAQIQATVASFRFPKIGSLHHNSDIDEFYIGPELQTGKGPWASSTEYYGDPVDHLLKSASAKDDLKQSQSFILPSILGHLMRIYGEETIGPFRLTNHDFGAHNILVNDGFEIVGVIDFDGVMAAPLEVVAQYPALSFLDTEPPGAVYTALAAIERIKRTASRLQEYTELLSMFESVNGEGEFKVADRLGSISACVYRGMMAYSQHQDFVNEKWMKACLKMLLEYAEGTQQEGRRTS